MSDNFFDLPEVAPAEDFLPSSGNFDPLKTGLYQMKITQAHFDTGKSGAKNVHIEMKRIDGSGPVVRENLCLASGDKKGNRKTFVDHEGIERLLPGLETFKQMHQIVTGKPLKDITIEKKILKLRNWETRTDEPREVGVPTDLINQPILAGIIERRENKRIENAAGKWVSNPDGSDRVFNVLDKVFYPDGGLTVLEKKAGQAKGEFAERWAKRWPNGKLDDRYKPVPAAAANGVSSDDDIPWGDDDDSTEDKPSASTDSLFQ